MSKRDYAVAVADAAALETAQRPNVLHRAIADLRRGDAVLLQSAERESAIIMAAEAIEDDWLARARAATGSPPLVAVTRRRALALGVDPGDSPVIELALPTELDAAYLQGVADPTLMVSSRAEPGQGRSVHSLSPVAIELLKLARLLPAAVLFPVEHARRHDVASRLGLVELGAATVAAYRDAAERSLRVVADARVPLADAEDARVVAFRPDDGGIDHLAIVIGEPPRDQPVLTRIHSECFTGDLLGSLRCDCGDQLRGAIRALAANATGGIVIYLAQEGRGIGLVNKLRAYRLQDAGFDTIDANEQLGFEADERVYQPAAEILRKLGYAAVRLLTNNPEKVAALAAHGVTVAERVPHAFTANDHNRAYLATKQKRGGHLF